MHELSCIWPTSDLKTSQDIFFAVFMLAICIEHVVTFYACVARHIVSQQCTAVRKFA